MTSRLFRIVLPVSDIEDATTFYGRLLHTPGKRVSPGSHYFNCGGTILACHDPRADGDEKDPQPNSGHVCLAVPDLEAHFARARTVGCRSLEPIETRPSGERSFCAIDPFGNPICLVDDKTVFLG